MNARQMALIHVWAAHRAARPGTYEAEIKERVEEDMAVLGPMLDACEARPSAEIDRMVRDALNTGGVRVEPRCAHPPSQLTSMSLAEEPVVHLHCKACKQGRTLDVDGRTHLLSLPIARQWRLAVPNEVDACAHPDAIPAGSPQYTASGGRTTPMTCPDCNHTWFSDERPAFDPPRPPGHNPVA